MRITKTKKVNEIEEMVLKVGDKIKITQPKYFESDKATIVGTIIAIDSNKVLVKTKNYSTSFMKKQLCYKYDLECQLNN